jgi:hypothetical protein
MVDSDLIAFPFCAVEEEGEWSGGSLYGAVSYWRENNWVRWATRGRINYFRVATFRSALHARSRTKGAEEGSESVISWDAIFSSRCGIVDAVDPATQRVTIRRSLDGHRHTWRVGAKQIVVTPGQQVEQNEIIACAVAPTLRDDLVCPGRRPRDHVATLLASRERTQRFTGVRLARLDAERAYSGVVHSLAQDAEEDIYVRLEAVSYLASVMQEPADVLFGPFLNGQDQQVQLESAIALGECGSNEAIESLCNIVQDPKRPLFLRSAAAWSLSQTRTETASRQLVQAFAEVSTRLREEALDGLAAIGSAAIPALLEGLRHSDDTISAGCAEVLRRYQLPTKDVVETLVRELESGSPQPWVVWLIGHLPREHFASSVASLQEVRPELHYAVSLLWSFVESWIARRWELRPIARMLEQQSS